MGAIFASSFSSNAASRDLSVCDFRVELRRMCQELRELQRQGMSIRRSAS